MECVWKWSKEKHEGKQNEKINKLYLILTLEDLRWNLEFEPVLCVSPHFWCNCDNSQGWCTDQ